MDASALRLEALGWAPLQARAWERLGDPELVAGRVASADRGSVVLFGVGPGRTDVALLGGSLQGGIEAPAVGDWVACRQEAGVLLVEHVLPRASCFVRRLPGKRACAQLVAAGIDTVLAVTAIGEDLSPRRIERYVTATLAGGAEPVVVVNKADRPHDRAEVAQLMEAAAPGVAVAFTSAVDAGGLDELNAWLVPGRTLAFVGSSGVGKSSLVNRLLGEARQSTRAVREADDKGRHTTTRRELVVAPSGVLLVDTPGMREMGLWAAEAGLAGAFPEIEELGAGCRFRDCRHRAEPECAVVAAVAAGLVPATRLSSYHLLTSEIAEGAARARESTNSKDRWRGISRRVRHRRRLHEKLGLKDR